MLACHQNWQVDMDSITKQPIGSVLKAWNLNVADVWVHYVKHNIRLQHYLLQLQFHHSAISFDSPCQQKNIPKLMPIHESAWNNSQNIYTTCNAMDFSPVFE
jgi:hypothetical protein